ncbi:hypothetical protein ETT63_03990 [Streptococcus pyogenes]|nr:hypothetical protein ETT63_03990 [Streptococcus pyogenes]
MSGLSAQRFAHAPLLGTSTNYLRFKLTCYRNSRNRTDLQPLYLLTTSKVATLVLLAVNQST